MDKTLKFFYINSTMAFVGGFILTTIFHEFGHFVSYYFFGADPVMYHNYVQASAEGLSESALIISALAGPFFSLAQGIIFGIIKIRRRSNDVLDLLFLWLSLLGFVNFFGYLMMTPLTAAGDTGKAAELLGLSYSIRIFIALLGLGTIIFIVLKIGRRFADFIPDTIESSARSKYVNSLILFPIITGSLINVLLAFPVQVLLSIIYPATSAYVIMSAYGAVLKEKNGIKQKSTAGERISLKLAVIGMTAIIFNRLLTQGWG